MHARGPRTRKSCAEVSFSQRMSCSTSAFWESGFMAHCWGGVQVCRKGKRKLTKVDRKREVWNNYVSTERLFDLLKMQEKGVSPRDCNSSQSANTVYFTLQLQSATMICQADVLILFY